MWQGTLIFLYIVIMSKIKDRIKDVIYIMDSCYYYTIYS